jgi:hypothetical protein
LPGIALTIEGFDKLAGRDTTHPRQVSGFIAVENNDAISNPCRSIRSFHIPYPIENTARVTQRLVAIRNPDSSSTEVPERICR